jgi:hypothetical protein
VRSSKKIMVGRITKDIALLKGHKHLLQARRTRKEGLATRRVEQDSCRLKERKGKTWGAKETRP